ncbi:MAG: response regulator [Lachnospiraceae bacterium]|nr:response regulator [Lachnospiraceae bacterium]
MYRIIVADDEPIERMVVEKIIKKYFPGQLEIVLGVNGREVMELFEEEQTHIALLDIEMPGINGLEAANRIREKSKDCSIIFLTAFDEFSYAKKAIAVKALDYLLKPVAEEELVAVLEEAIRIQEAMQQEKTKDTPAVNNEILQPDVHIQENGNENLRMNAVTESIRLYIENHYMEDIALQDVAAAMNYSDAYFCKLFKQCFDKSFVSYLTWFRVEKAKELLADVLVNVKEISINVGYRDSNYFTKVFKRLVGVTPSEYRLQVLQKDENI